MVAIEQRLPWIVFGESSQGQLLAKKDIGTSEDGTRMVEIRFRPTEELMQKYGFPREQLDEEFSLTFQYPSAYCIFLSDDPVTQTLLIFCDVKGRDTKLTNLNAHLLDTLIGYEKRIKALQAQNAWLHAEIKKQTSHLSEYVKQNSDLFMQAIRVRGDIDTAAALGMGMPAPGKED